jgi:hypothetical protein
MIFLMLLPASSSFSQSVFTTKTLSQVTLTTEKQDQINKVSLMPRIGSLIYATVSNRSSWGMSNDGSFTLSVPGNTGSYLVTELGSRLTFAHEIAHNLGARHARLAIPGGTDPTNDCAHAWSYTGNSGNARPTVLGPLGLSGARIPYYSNPYISFDGFATGSLGTNSTTAAYNARKIRNAFCEVQNFEKPTQMYAQIQGPVVMCPGDNINFQALITYGSAQGNNPSSTCTWDYSTSPNGPFTALSTGGACNAWIASNLIPSGGYLYLRLGVTPNTGSGYGTSKKIYFLPSCFQGGSDLEDREMKMDYVKEDFAEYLVPNPASDAIKAGTNNPNSDIQQIIIYSSNGKEVLRTAHYQEGFKEITVDLSKLSSGLYYVVFRTSSGIVTKKFTHLN